MGLDQYAYKTKREEAKGVDFKLDSTIDEELCYWRKHPNLQGLMEEIYRKKGGKAEDFNVVPVELTKEDLIEIGDKVINSKLPSTKGFFFGSESDDRYFEDDVQFLEKAKKAISEGYIVYYTSWW
tara:strand:- start:3532 stop:3906 length:375 start_codon:yes stop_codon:yes gene_type:complete